MYSTIIIVYVRTWVFFMLRNVVNQRSNVNIIIARKEGGAWERIINPRRACAAGVTVLGWSLTLGAHVQRGLQ